MKETDYSAPRPEGPGNCPWGCGPLKLVGVTAELYIQPRQRKTDMYSCRTCGYCHGNTPIVETEDQKTIARLRAELVEAEMHIHHLERLVYDDFFGGFEDERQHANEMRYMAQRIREGR